MTLTPKPIIQRRYSLATGEPRPMPYVYSHKPKLSERNVIRQRYRRPSIRLRAVGSREQTSVKLADLYSPHITVNGQPLEMKTSAGRLMARDLFG